jgi:hypothetical protein
MDGAINLVDILIAAKTLIKQLRGYNMLIGL